jgi:hypothetical protein
MSASADCHAIHQDSWAEIAMPSSLISLSCLTGGEVKFIIA